MAISAFWPVTSTTSTGITKVANTATRLALSPTDGDVVIQLDNDTLYEYDGTTTAWVVIGGYGLFVEKAGDTMTGDLLFTSGDGIDSVASGTTTLNIGTTNADVINIGNGTCTVNINGSVNNNNVTNLNVTDKVITINDGGAAASGFSSGIEVEENGSATAYVSTSSDRNSWELKSPANAGIVTIKTGTHNFTLDTSSIGSSTKTYTALNASGVVALSSAALTSGSVPYVTTSGVLTENTSNFTWNNTVVGLGLGVATGSVAARLHVSGSTSAASWTSNGLGVRVDAQTFTNTSSSGTVAVQAGHAIGGVTFNSSSAVTVTDGSTLYIAAAAAGTGNTTVTRGWALYCPSGKQYFADGANFGTSTQTSTIRVSSSMSNTNAAANAVYASGSVSVTSAGSYQSATLTGDGTISGTQNNTNSVGMVAVDAISRVTNTATVTSNIGVRAITTNTSTGTVTNNYNFRAVANTNSGGGVVTNQFSFSADDQTMTATNVFGFYGNISSGSGKWNLYAAGTATNYMAGSLLIGTTSVTTGKVNVITSATDATVSGCLMQSTLTQTADTSSFFSTGFQADGLLNQGSFNNTVSTGVRGVYGTARCSGSSGTVGTAQAVMGQVFNTGAGTITTGYSFRGLNATNSGGGVIGTLYGFFQDNVTTATTLAAAFSSNMAAASTKWCAYMSGTADNHFAGRVLVGSTDTTIGKSVVVGNVTTEVTQVVRGVSSQSANLQNWQNSTPTTVASIGINGSLTAGPTSSSAATHSILGAQKWTTRSVTGNVTIDTTTTDMIILADTTSSAITVTMPAHADGRIIIIKDKGYNALTNNITVARASGGNIENVAGSYTMNANGESATFVSDGSSWHRL